MNKKLLAVALATAFAAPAMAEGVQIYGAFDVGVLSRFNNTDGGKRARAANGYGSGNGQQTTIASGMNGHNGIGFKMSEDLGNGMTISGDAMFGFALDAAGSNFTPSGSGGFNAIYSYLALSGDFGTVIGGRAGGARAGFIKQYDAFGGFGVGGSLATMNSALGNADYADNVLAYITPEVFPGMKVLAAYTSNLVGQDGTPKSGDGQGVRTDLYAIAALYNQGPISLTAAYENLIVKDSGTATGAGTVLTTPASATALGGGHIDVWTAGASYDFGVAKVMALYTYLEGYQHGYQVGARAPLGAATVKLGYSSSTSTNLNAAGGAATGTVSGQCAKVAAGVDYDLSKRTRIYADVAHLTQDDVGGACATGLNTYGGSYASSGGGRDNGAGFGKTGANVGIRHAF